MQKALLLLIGLLLQCAYTQAQNTAFLDSLTTTPLIDSLFIDKDISNYSLRGFVNIKNQQFRFTETPNQVKFSPNNPGGIGFGFANKKILIDFAFNLKLNEKEPTSRYDLRASLKQKSHYFDFFFQHYKGFNVQSNNTTQHFRPDISSLFTGINYLYVLNNKNYNAGALRSVISQHNKTAFSYGVGGFGIIINQKADSALYGPIPNNDFNNESINRVFGTGLGALFGISGFFDMTHNFYSSIALNAGAGLMYKEISVDSGIYNPNKIMLYQLNSTAALGYLRNKFYVNLMLSIGFYDTHIADNSREIINLSQAKVAFGYKIFKK